MCLKALKLATKHKALGFQGDILSCCFHSLQLIMEVADHHAPLGDFSFTPMPKGIVP